MLVQRQTLVNRHETSGGLSARQIVLMHVRHAR
jgi:hypothetical protein